MTNKRPPLTTPFTRANKSKDKDENQAKETELFQQIGNLQMELEWFKKKSQLL